MCLGKPYICGRSEPLGRVLSKTSQAKIFGLLSLRDVFVTFAYAILPFYFLPCAHYSEQTYPYII